MEGMRIPAPANVTASVQTLRGSATEALEGDIADSLTESLTCSSATALRQVRSFRTISR